MAKRLSDSAQRELVAAVRARYGARAPSVTQEILRELAAITGYQHNSTINILTREGAESAALASEVSAR